MAVVLAGIWTGHHLGGFAWQSDPKHQFNWHPLLMTLGMIYLYGNGKYRVRHPNRTPYMGCNLGAAHCSIYLFTKYVKTLVSCKLINLFNCLQH